MIARYTGAILGLLAFAVTVTAGVWVENPASVTLTRAIGALLAFCIVGFVVGGAAQFVINDYAKRRYTEAVPAEAAASGNDGNVSAGSPRKPAEPTEN